MLIEQATYGGQDADHRILARSPGFLDSWLPEVERLCAGFGDRPHGAACPLAVFAQPLGRGHVAVVQVADQPADDPTPLSDSAFGSALTAVQGADDPAPPRGLAFRLLVLPARLYGDLGGDPFRVSDQHPPDWQARGELPALQWTAGPAPRRLVGELSGVLNVEAERTQTLLGGVQILVDGGRLAFERPAPDEKVVRDLWALLPTNARKGLWPASFAFGNALRFHVVVTPKADGPDFDAYVREPDAGNYPEGHYELALQQAVEHNDQGGLDALLARRSRSQVLWLAVVLLIGFTVASLVLNWGRKDQEGGPAGGPNLVKEESPDLAPGERADVAAGLRRMGKQLGLAAPAGDEDAALSDALAALDQKLDEKLGEGKPERRLDALASYGPVRSQVRALAWKYGLEEYNATDLNAASLLRRWEARLVKERILQGGGGE